MHDLIFDALWYDNSVFGWLQALTATISVTLGLRFGNRAIAKRLAILAPQTASSLDDLLLNMMRGTTLAFQLAIGIFAGAQFVDLQPNQASWLRMALGLLILWQIGLWGTGAVHHSMVVLVDRRTAVDDRTKRSGRYLLQSLAIGCIWAIVALLSMKNVGIDVTTVVAGLGVTGVAVALAGQQIGSDLLASASILLDQSFLVGDFIIVDQYWGTIERIGVMKTHLRSLSGEVIVFANSDLLKSRVRNYRTLSERRILFDFGIESTTPVADIEQLVGAMPKLVGEAPNVRFDRGHWASFTEHALRIEVVYYVLSGEYNAYMDAQQHINLAIMRFLQQQQIRLAVGIAVRTTPLHKALPTTEEARLRQPVSAPV